MADRFTFAITGGEALEAALRQLPEAVGKNRLSRSLRKTAEPVKEAIERHAPRGQGEHMADHIAISSVREEDYTATVAVGPERRWFYGLFLEWGTSVMAARPFMRPAWDQVRGGLIPELGRHLWAELSAAARRLARGSGEGGGGVTGGGGGDGRRRDAQTGRFI